MIAALKGIGIRVQRGYPAEKMPCLNEAVISVSVERLQIDAVILGIRIYAPISQGGTACEDLAMRIMPVLTALGGNCTVEHCSFDGRAGLFALPVQVRFSRAVSAETASVKVDGVLQPYVNAFKAEYLSVVNRTFNTTTGQPIFHREDDGWRLTIEELLPEDRPAEDENMEVFSVEYSSGAGVQRYEHCCWERILVEPVVSGIHRIRVARAARSPVITPLT